MPAIWAKEQTDFWGISGGVRVDWKTLNSDMGLAIFILLVCWCFVVPPVLLWMGKVRRLTVIFWAFFGITAILNGCFMKFFIDLLYGWSDSDDWVPFVGPALVLLPFTWMIYSLERGTRKPVAAAIIAVFGSFPVTALWLISSALFMSR